jgi:4-amino-4-deoxy-L-arabinose transferase-like glycosyltransferase
MKSVSSYSKTMQLNLLLFSYLIFASVFGFTYRYVINPDGISDLRFAGYIAEGKFLQSVSAGYSPFIAWTMSPFILMGFDGPIAARIAIALAGAGMLVCVWFLALRFNLSESARFLSVIIAALLISFWSIQNISADILFASLTLCYIYLVTDSRVITRRKISFLCGIAGGFSYLAHHYALPFFLVHFPTMMFLRGYLDREKAGYPWKNVLSSWVSGMTGLLIIVSIWVGIVSVKYGHLMVSAKGGVAHAIMGPKDVDRRHPFFVGGLFKPRDNYSIHVFEDPSEVKFKTWSPFESKEYFMHQLKVIRDNAVYILNHFVNKSPFFTYISVVGILVFIPVAFLLNPLSNSTNFLYSWVVLTFCIYCSGFLVLIARSPRRFYALMIVFMLLSFHFLEQMTNVLKDAITGRRKKVFALYLLIIVISAFTVKPGVQFLKSIHYLVTLEQINPYKEIAAQINTVQFPPPFAIIRSSQKPHTDTFISYYLKKQLLGRPLSKDVEGITQELKNADARSLLVFDNPEIVENLKRDKRYSYIASIKFKDNKRYESTVNINIKDHEIITGWDDGVTVFTLN